MAKINVKFVLRYKERKNLLKWLDVMIQEQLFFLQKVNSRLYQVEYAMEAINHAGTCLSLISKEGIIMVAENRITNKLLDDEASQEKIYRLNSDIICSVAGITADANVLVAMLRQQAQKYRVQYGESIPVEFLVSGMCDYKQAYTQYGGKRPFGVSILYGGWDTHFGYQLYQSDPSGNYTGWKASCIGNNSQAAIPFLQQDYDYETATMDSIKNLAMKVMCRSLEAKLTCERMEVATLCHVDGKTEVHVLTKSEITEMIENSGVNEDESLGQEVSKRM
ncbi:Proteasome subunit alpha type-4 [Trichinella zimbabwensis]|uniref:Proteasome subunit alpha type-4 n=3 Tax=Trichinella TaxID=6333 RepID=A0A0V1MJM8_9BILA|nr:Proteasome subunit alpha type-4 [Trichinella zimbabwensis]KRZ72007.1 Proteasome subunit alpha type-4 [Trichinella papuae]